VNAVILILSVFCSFIIIVPLGIRWEIERKIAITAAFVIGIFSYIVTSAILLFHNPNVIQLIILETIIILTTTISLLLWRFYRDPERVPPEQEHVILSAADGKVIYVKSVEDGNIPESEKKGRKFSLSEFVESHVLPEGGYVVGISMNYLDVHVNRTPISGRISLLKHIKGKFLSLKKPAAVLENERVLTVIDNGDFKVGIVQIASRLVRKIVPYLKEGDEIQIGARMGMIRFGSQVDMVLPNLACLVVKVTPGMKVKAGISVIAILSRKDHEKYLCEKKPRSHR